MQPRLEQHLRYQHRRDRYDRNLAENLPGDLSSFARRQPFAIPIRVYRQYATDGQLESAGLYLVWRFLAVRGRRESLPELGERAYSIASSTSVGNLPFFPLTSAGQTTITLPFIPTNSCNIFLAVGTAPTIPLNGLSPPTPPTSYYDIVEFTFDANGVATSVPSPYEHLPTLNIDTSQVTQFGMPLEVTGQTTTSQSTSVGVTPSVNRETFFTAYTNFVNATAPGPMSTPSPYASLIVNNSGPGSPPPFGILNPTEYIGQGEDTSGQFAPVFNAALVHLFEQQHANPAAPTLNLKLDSTDGVWTGVATTVTAVSSDNNPNSGKTYNVLKFTNSADGTIYVYEPFFTTNGFADGGPAGSNLTASTVQTAPSWITATSESPGEMVFGNDGAFDDAANQLDPTTGKALSANQRSALGNIEDQLVAALNRGIADVSFSGDTTTAWTTASHFYPSGHEANAYAAFMHSNAYPTATLPFKELLCSSTTSPMPSLTMTRAALLRPSALACRAPARRRLPSLSAHGRVPPSTRSTWETSTSFS